MLNSAVVFCCITSESASPVPMAPSSWASLPPLHPHPTHLGHTEHPAVPLFFFFTTLLLLILSRHIKGMEFKRKIWGLDHSLKYFVSLLRVCVCVVMIEAVIISKQVF